MGTSVLQLRATEIGLQDLDSDVRAADPTSNSYLIPLSPDGLYWATMDTTTLHQVVLTDARSHEVRSRQTVPKAGSNTMAFTADSRHLVAHLDDHLTIYSVPDLSIEHRIDLPAPVDLGPQNTTNILNSWVTSLFSPAGNEIADVYGGTLTLWNADTGAIIDRPLPLGRDIPDATNLASRGHVIPRTGHPREILVSTSSGEIRRWDVSTRRELGVIRIGKMNPYFKLRPGDTTGSRLVTLTAAGELVTWDIETGQPVYSAGVVAPDTATLVGFGQNDTVITLTSGSPYKVQIWDLSSRHQLGELTPIKETHHWFVRGDQLIGSMAATDLAISLDPHTGFTQLCAGAGRDFTDTERGMLPAGADDRPPCRSA